ncbi:hypothetical protein L218DRAFT_641497 [Marasmius fiardii PR-910]|nr:hypothetical protein L218DRAFT_641497 [Marasmius fiardii PR-910]
MAENVDLGNTFGAMLIGAMISMGLYGITTLQTYFYFRHYERDNLEVKSLVSAVWILDTVHVGFMGHSMYYYLITGYGKPQLLQTGIWSLYSSLLLNIIVAFISQTFFTRQIYFLCPRPWKWLVTIIIALIVLAHFETVVQFFLIKQFSRLNEVDHVAVVPFGTLAILSDIMVAAALVILLRRSRTELQDTNSLINKLIVYAVNRCILTSVVAVLEVILFLSFPHSLYAFAFDFVIGKLYANSLLAHLNSRKSLVKRNNSRGTFTSTSFAVATPGEFSLRGLESTTTGTSPSSRGAQGDEESRIYSTSISTTDKRRPAVLRYDTDTEIEAQAGS